MAVQVQGPTRVPREGGIKAIVGDFTEVSRINAPEGALVWEDSTCGFPKETWADCVRPEEADPKEGDGIEQYTTIGDPFARYKGVQCYLGGDSEGPSYEDQAREALEAGEDREIEAVLVAWAEDADDSTTEDDLGAAIARAEQYADTAYVGRPILIMSRYDAQIAYDAGALSRKDGELVTGNKTPVLATGVATEGTVSITGAIGVYVSPILVRPAPEIRENVMLAIAERVYAVGVDCDFRYAVSVETTP